MTITTVTVVQLMSACVSELGFSPTTCTCSGKQWYLTATAISRVGNVRQAAIETQTKFLQFLRDKGVSIEKLTINQSDVRGFRLSNDGTRISIYGSSCFTLRELCEALVRAME